MMNSIPKTVLVACLLSCYAILQGQGLVVNELSNGLTGTKEFFELVVVGTGLNEACGDVDIRGMIVDDNNGDFSCGACAATGIATGHLRFTSAAQWAAVQPGSIIVIYNNLDIDPLMPAADPDDTAPADGVYIVPSNSPLLEYSITGSGCTNSPTGLSTCGVCSGISGYASACYTSFDGWTNVGLRNQGDAAQVRRPDGSYFHGFAYGTPANNMGGGADGLINPITGTALSFFNANSVNNNYRSAANWSSISSASATPGAGNTAANTAWINLLSICILPVEYAMPLEAKAISTGNELRWATSAETGSSHFAVMRSTAQDGEFVEIGSLAAAGTSNGLKNYRFLDTQAPAHAFYRLEQVDINGQRKTSDIVEVFGIQEVVQALRFWPHPTAEVLNYEATGTDLMEVSLLDALGRVVQKQGCETGSVVAVGQMDMGNLLPGIYFLQVRSGAGMLRKQVVHLK